MFFCFGSPRSGTTLISQSLAAHPNIVVPSETDFIVPTAFLFDRIKDPIKRQVAVGALITSSEYYPHSLAEFLREGDVFGILRQNIDNFPGFLTALYAQIATRAGAEIAGDKSPNDIHFIRILEKTGAIIPSMKVIHIVRDVRDVLGALVARQMSPGIEIQYARMWSAHNCYLNTWMGDQPNYMLVRYEDFAVDPEANVRRLLEFLGQRFDPVTLDPAKRHPRLQASHIHDMLYRPTSTEKIGSFRSVLAPDLVELCEMQAAEGMTRFGYAPG